MRRSKQVRLVVAIALLTSACGRDGSFSADFAAQTQDFEELREQLNVRIPITGSVGTLPFGCTTATGCTPGDFRNFIRTTHCQQQSSHLAMCPASPPACLAEACTAQLQLCVANTLLEITTLTAPQVYGSSSTSLTVPPQTAATNSELARLAYQASRTAFDRSAVSLGATASSPENGFAASTSCTGASPTNINDLIANSGITIVEWLVSALGESAQTARESAGAMRSFSQAVSDARLSTDAQEERARGYSLNLPFASRGSAAHTLTGGAMGLPLLGGSAVPVSGSDSFTSPLFGGERLSAEGTQALEYLRMAGPPPSAIVGASSVDDLLTTVDWGTPPVDNLRSRLTAIIGDTTLATQSATGIYQRLGVSREGFVEARNYLRQELRAFGREGTVVTLAAERLPNSSALTTWPIYAATRTRPQRPLRTWWNALLRYQTAAPSMVSGGQNAFQPITSTTNIIPAFAVPVAGYADIDDPSYLSAEAVTTPSSVASFLDGATTALRRARTSTMWLTNVNSTNRTLLEPRFSEILSDLEGSVEGRVRFCWQQQTTSPMAEQRLRVSVWGEEDQGALLLVRGRDALECAVRGRIDGVACSITSNLLPIYDVPGVAGTSLSSTVPYGVNPWAKSNLSAAAELASHGYSRQLDATFQLQVSGAATAQEVYVVRHRPDRSTNGPGDWLEFSGARLPAPTAAAAQTLRYCITMPVVPEMEDAAKDTVEINPNDPTSNTESCAGVPFDQRIPLENELTSNGDDIESSWRHYLEVAEQAAARADALGEDLIRNGLENDMRSERAIDELEDICGSTVNLASVGTLTSNTGSRPARTAARVSGNCPAGYSDMGGSLAPCVLDPVAWAATVSSVDEDASALASCLGGGTTGLGLVTLANVPVCVWVTGTDVSTMCQGATADLPCPFEARYAGDTYVCDSARVPEGATATLVTDALGFFGIPDDETNTTASATAETDDTNPCVALANLREAETPRFRNAVNDARGTLLSSAALSALSPRIGFRAGARDVARVTFDGTTVLRTGFSDGRTVSEWPCAALPTGSYGDGNICPTDAPPGSNFGGPALHCLQLNCTKSNERAVANSILARAVIAARLLGGASLEGLEFPWYPRAGDDALWLTDPQGWSSGEGSTGFQESVSGGLSIWNGGGGDWDNYVGDFGALRAVAQRVDGREWTLVDASNNVVEIFDDDADSDDLTCTASGPGGGPSAANDRRLCERNLPLFIRRLPASMAGDDPNTAAAQWWSTGFGGGPSINEIVAQPTVQGLALDALTGAFREANFEANDLTHYWLRSGCGGVGGRDCNGPFARDSGEERRALRATQLCAQNTLTAPCSDIGCNTRYMSCNAAAEESNIDFQFTFDGNRAFIAPQGLTRSDVLNGLELLCAASRNTVEDPTMFGCAGDPPTISSISDVLKAEDYLRCRANSVRRRLGMTVMSGIPTDVVRRLRSRGAMSIGGGGGEYDAQVSQLASALYDLQAAQTTILNNADEVANAIRTLRNAVGQSTLAGQIEDLQLASTIANNITECVVTSLNSAAAAVRDTSSSFGATAGLQVGVSVATCANNIFQSVIATQVHDLRRQGLELQTEEAFIEFERRYQNASTTLTQQVGQLQSSLQQIDASLARIRSIQQRGRRAVGQALFLDSDTTGRTFPVNTVSRRRLNTSVARYQRARADAIRSAYLARRALEQRLGMDLRDMNNDMTLVEAPSNWSETLCSMPAIDYDRIRAATPGVTGDRASDPGSFDGPAGYSGAFVGDYVQRLRQVFESYSFVYPFQDGRDTAVLSLRDDIMGIRADCPVDTPNWLFWAGSFNQMESEDGPGWRAEGCAVSPTWPYPTEATSTGIPELAPYPPPSCFRAFPVGTDTTTSSYRTTSDDESRESPLRSSSADFGRISGYRLEFGVDKTVSLPGGGGVEYEAVNSGTRAIQWVDLPAGRYRLSWYGRSTASLDPATCVEVVSATQASPRVYTEETSVSMGARTESAPDGAGWVRYSRQFDAPANRTVGIAITTDFPTTAPMGRRTVDLGAFMVESLPSQAATGSLPVGGTPGPYFDTTDVRERTLRVCEDTHGAVFRRTAWSYGCTRVCPDGFDGDCDPRYASERCFWETSFSASSDRLERLATTTASGFAAGNYNYRIEGVGLNFVGTGLRDCGVTGGPTPSTCYATGNIRYSVLHGGPYLVRNAVGALYSAPIFPGRIESARGVAAERYFTNPISSADQSLMQPYIRNELRGRPLGGTVSIRVWDEPGLRFDNLEDVQLVLNYRYWTHQR